MLPLFPGCYWDPVGECMRGMEHNTGTWKVLGKQLLFITNLAQLLLPARTLSDPHMQV